VFREYESGGRLCSYQPRLNPDAEDAKLRVRQILHESLTPDLETQNPALLYSHRSGQGRDEFFLFNRSNDLQRFRLRLRPAEAEPERTHIVTLNPATGEEKALVVWMAQPREQGGGLGLSIDLAAGEARRLYAINGNVVAERIESATFEVAYFDGKTARGYAIQNGAPKLALRCGKNVQWHTAQSVVLPSPMLLDDWGEPAPGEYSQRVALPPDWHACRVFLEVAPLRGMVKVEANGLACGMRFAAPLRFDVSAAVKAKPAELHLILRMEERREMDSEILARLTAYPNVEISIKE
jgi:hypothetical protein